jgi:hypothetical protein
LLELTLPPLFYLRDVFGNDFVESWILFSD